MRLLCLYGIGQKTETIGSLLPSSRALRTPWQIFIPGIFVTILNGCLTLWCSNSNTTAHCVDGESFCRPREIHPITPINDVVEFLSYLYDNGGRVGVIATARSTLGNFILVPGVPVLVNHPLTQKVVKGAYNTRHPAPRYVVIWDTEVLLQYLDSLDNTCLDFKLLSCKTAILLTILFGQRVSTIHAFRLSSVTTDN